MKPIQQLCKKISTIGDYIKYYLLSSLIFIIVFSLVYYLNNIENPIKNSIGIFWDLPNQISSVSMSFWVTAEVIVSQLFSIIIATSVLIKFLKPLNPIILADKIAYNTKTKRFRFCYWIIWPEGRFLYNTTIRIFIANRLAHQAGVNSLPVEWESKDETVTKLRLSRGIRYVQLGEDESKEFYKILNSIKHLPKDSLNAYEINLVISGSDETGNRFYAWKRYNLGDVCYGYQFVPLQQHEYTDKRFFQGNDEDLNINVDDDKLKKELFRYQHFGKLFPLKKIKNKDELKALKKYLLYKDQIINGQYGSIKQKCLDFCNWIIMYFLDNYHWKAWCISVFPKKKAKNMQKDIKERPKDAISIQKISHDAI